MIVAAFAGCSSPTTVTPPPTVVTGLSLTCPAATSAVAPIGSAAQAVTFTATVTGGTPPVNVICTPASGSAFPIGSTPVNCSAADAIGRTATCSSSVTVAGHVFGAQKIIAFGDSITAGQNGLNGDNTGIPPGCSPAGAVSSAIAPSFVPQFIDVSHSYPAQLQAKLQTAFPAPAPVVANLGVSGELATAGASRLPATLKACALDTLLLLEGINDLDANVPQGTIVAALQSDVDNAKAAGVKNVFIGTLLPQRDCVNDGTVIECAVLHANTAAINSTNVEIKLMASGHGAIAVDLNAAFKAADPTLVSLISNDGLHPTTAGFTLIAQTFFNAMLANIPVVSVRQPLAVSRQP